MEVLPSKSMSKGQAAFPQQGQVIPAGLNGKFGYVCLSLLVRQQARQMGIMFG